MEPQHERGQKPTDGEQIAHVLRNDTPNTTRHSTDIWLLAQQRQPTVHDFGPDLRGMSRLRKAACLRSRELRMQRHRAVALLMSTA
jgi:hypothetical protein